MSARSVSLESVIHVAARGGEVELSRDPRWRRRIRASRAILEQALRQGAAVYGVSTGVGNSSSRRVGRDRQEPYALSIVAQHGCGVGEPFSELEGRAIVFVRLVGLSKGLSAVRPELLQALCALLNRGVIPVIPRLGSVGASGDLTPLSYVAAVLSGDREAYFRGKVLPASKALRAAGLRPYELAPKESLAIMNGTSVMAAIGIVNAHRFARLLGVAERATALAVEVLRGRSQAFAPLVHASKGHPGQIESASIIRDALRGSRLTDPGEIEGRQVQDRYSLRCSPQILGAARDALAWGRQVLTVELNSSNDNPIVDPDSRAVYFGGNFYGGHVALGMDLMKVAAATVVDMIDRQFALLVDEHQNLGLPETLVPYDGNGVRGLQITCSALSALAVQRSAPDGTLSRPTECGNQDRVSMGLNAALNASEVLTCLARVLATHLIAVSNAARLRDERRLSRAGREILLAVRRRSAVLTADRRLDRDVRVLAEDLEQERGLV